MLRVTTANAVPGMTIALPVFHPGKPGHVLLKPGATLDARAIERLLEYRIGVLWVRYPALEFLARYINPSITTEHAKLTAVLAKGFDDVSRRSHAQFDFTHYANAVSDLLARFIDTPDAALFFQDVLDSGSAMCDHASNTCFLSLLMGLKLDGYLVNQRTRIPPHRAKRIENLGLGAMLHDIGMLRLSPELHDEWNRTHSLENPEIRRHVLLGFDLLRGRIPPTAAAVALHHHQRFDGSGFPAIRRLDGLAHTPTGNEIHIFSRIVAVADTFDRLRNPPTKGPDAAERGYRPRTPLPAVRALRAMLEMATQNQIDPIVFRALLYVAPAYAPGSMVVLSDGRSGVVTGWDPLDPCRPTITPLLRPVAQGVDEGSVAPAVDLRQHPSLSVVEVDGQAVGDHNFYLRTTPAKPGHDKPGLEAIPHIVNDSATHSLGAEIRETSLTPASAA